MARASDITNNPKDSGSLQDHLATGPDGDVIAAGINSGLAEYDLSDTFNEQTRQFSDGTSAQYRGLVTPFTDSNSANLLITRQERLLQLRANNPFVPILMFPSTAKAAVLLAGVAQDIPIPSGAKYVVLRGNGDYWVSVNGNAQVPAASVGLTDDGIASIYRPDGVVYFCEEINSLSVVSAAGCIVSALFYLQQ